MTEKVEDVAVEETVATTPKHTIVIDVEDGQLSVSSSTSVVDTLMMLNAATAYVLERAMVNQHVAEEAEVAEEE